MNSKYWPCLYFACLLLQLTAIAMHWETLRVFTKPMLVICLLVWFLFASFRLSPIRYWIATALFFSLAGDVCLLKNGDGFFMAGLGSFLLAHIMYTVFFLRLRQTSANAPHLNILLVIIAVAYALSLFIFLYPNTGSLKIPVGVYATVITIMFITAAHATNTSPARIYFITGAILFVLSDSLLAINKFYQPLPAGDLGVMLTYGLAQFALIKGSLLYLADYKTRGPGLYSG